jgi:hypothetical protein
VQYELDRAPASGNDEIRVGGLNLESAAAGGRDSNQSNRAGGSEVDIKEAIHKVMQDE